jgi:predicted pyridoxine 5'-phosphate oxidase superfamily flavin-nucleotide-binding protein
MANEYHSGELEVQARAGVREVAKRVAGSIHSFVPQVARAFLEERRFVVVATVDSDNRPWASALAGPSGFVRAQDEHTIRIDASPAPGDPVAMNLRTGSFVGLIVPDLATRRRLRINGRLEVSDSSILIHVNQAYSNCPKYIQLREPSRELSLGRGRLAGRSSSLLPHERDWIQAADTFFIATLVPGEGADASHRGGMPGFVTVENRELSWPDYAGNGMFNTLGNITKYPRAGLLVLDFATGSTLQLTGRASIDWNPAHSATGTDAERLVRFTPDDVVEIDGVLSHGMRLIEYSPFNPTVATE